MQDFKVKNSGSPTKHGKKQTSPKKPIKLTLPKPIMHNVGQNGEYIEEKYDKFYIEEKETLYQERYVPQDVKYTSIPETKFIENGKFVEAVKFVDSVKFVDNTKYIVDSNGKLVLENKYVIDNGKYVEASTKFLEKDLDKGYVYQTYEELPYQDGYVERDRKESGLKIKLR